ncbi:class I SAM-dependent methyltransferase [Acetobacter sacchari]|uniref:Class I SAM-dependent methyltransferase n=1 Tax=Acetobacter sacchari TaxID=2661687 RepID=A0ABS3M0C5_9PROT|nr:class I SAM-dependent methyltransferase [Acetobacter sacchari]MBO1361622.1 class I SAM-dependent methyltransferase [Acetobacter sacchari]
MTESYAAHHYGARAQDYVASTVHSQGGDLDAIERAAQGKQWRRVLDLGCGGGHVAYRLAAHAAEVIACDVTDQMLRAVDAEAICRGLTNIRTIQAPAERLPFEDGAFDAVFCRFTMHHWNDAAAGLREARRVLARHGEAMFIDVTAPTVAVADSWLQTLELLRDVSHVRNYSVAEWRKLLGDAGFVLKEVSTDRLRMEFGSWVARTQTPQERIAAIRSLQEVAPEDVARILEIENDGSFTLDVSIFSSDVM